MQVRIQTLEELLSSLSDLQVDWRDPVAHRVIERLDSFKVQDSYSRDDMAALLDEQFDDGLLLCRLFLGLSKDAFSAAIRAQLGGIGAGVTFYRANREAFLDALDALGVREAMTIEANRVPRWSDVLVERLRSGRGSAISGQKRGRGTEAFVEEIVKRIFSEYALRCNFQGQDGRVAKCDIAIPSAAHPRILIETKAYGATGSKMTDVIGDIEKIIKAKTPNMDFLLVTDGMTWSQRQSDLRKIVAFQNLGYITRVYTHSMANQFEQDLLDLKHRHSL
ncbi:DpnII family type II restriction endonuclease [Burkholderia ambifaria]|uniref:DpnII family type II restriction endonuclease n=1 Tax=Burkholderia ambifaria TaxID=152480 RepID=UPI00158D20B0|nr:DpnII family type II restriction endonuclease [Burkholderia ambifaria]